MSGKSMGCEVIEHYINDILSKQLLRLGTSPAFVKRVTETVRNQMLSCVYYWNVPNFRKTLLVTGAEEGLFYQPKVDDDIRNFVVITLRNSELEWLQTENYRLAGLRNKLIDAYVKPLTSSAIEYFSKVDLNAISDEMEEIESDIYGGLDEKYPIAMDVLTMIATVEHLAFSYTKTEFDKPTNLDALPVKDEDGKNLHHGDLTTIAHTVVDGMSFSIDPHLLSELKHCSENQMPFIVDSFKSLTRNIEKLLLIMEYILSHGAMLVTSNYFIANGYIEKRKTLLKAGHTYAEMLKNWKDLDGLGANHKEALKRATEGIK